MLERHAGMTRTSGLAVGVSELLVEVATLCSLVALIAGALPGQRWALIGALVVLGPAVVLLIVLPRVRSALRDGLRPLRNLKTVGAIVLLSSAEWLIESGMIVVTAKATGLNIGFALGTGGIDGAQPRHRLAFFARQRRCIRGRACRGSRCYRASPTPRPYRSRSSTTWCRSFL